MGAVIDPITWIAPKTPASALISGTVATAWQTFAPCVIYTAAFDLRPKIDLNAAWISAPILLVNPKIFDTAKSFIVPAVFVIPAKLVIPVTSRETGRTPGNGGPIIQVALATPICGVIPI